MKEIYGMAIDETKPMKEVHDINHGINFGMFYVDEKHGFGFEVVKREILKRATGFKTAPEARKAGFEEAKKIIEDIEST